MKARRSMISLEGSLSKFSGDYMEERHQSPVQERESFDQAARNTRPLPKGWEWKRLGETCTVILGQSPESATYNANGNGMPFFQGKAEFGDRFPIVAKWCSAPRKVGNKNDVLISVRAPVGPTNIAPSECCIGRGLAALRPLDGIGHLYLLHYLRSIEHRLAEMGTGTTFKAISGDVLRSIEIPIAPLPQQKLIVAEIEKQFSRLDEAVANLMRVKANIKRYKAAVLKAAVEGKLTEEWRKAHPNVETGAELLTRVLAERKKKWEEKNPGKKYKEPAAPNTSKLPELPEGWVWATLGQCFRVAVGATPSRKEPSYWNGNIPWVSSGEVQFTRVRSTSEFISESGLENSSTQINPAGSVLLGMIGEGKTRGQSAILEIPAANNQNCAAIWVSESPLKPEYLYYWFMQRYEETRRIGSGNNQQALNKAIIERMSFPLPPITEHNVIVENIERRLSLYEEIEASINANLARAGNLRQSVLHRAFCGKLS